MKSFERQNTTIRQYLLGKLSDEQAEKLEDRIFTEPDFAEEVQIVEGELIADQRAGRLSSEDSQRLVSRYKATAANRFNVEFETAFGEFVCSKSDGVTAPQLENLRDTLPENLRDTLPESLRDTLPESLRDTLPEKSQEPFLAQGGLWQRFVIRFGPPAAYAAIAIAILFVGIVAWYLIPRIWSSPDLPAQNREVIEAELAQLNSAGASPGSIWSIVDLQIAHRSGGAMARIALNTTPDKVLEFHLNLAQLSARRYRVLIFDDRRNELFAVSNLTAQDTPNGPQIRLLIPVKYLKPGDYQVDLSVAKETGGYDQVNSYAFRVADTRN